MEQATSAIQSAKTNQQIFSAMKEGVKEMKKVYNKLDVDEIDVSHFHPTTAIRSINQQLTVLLCI
jgi:hypothetical protein